MELPSCPSCGQSVLDDDAADCPFCGAAMDGSSGGKKPAAPQPNKPEKQAKPADSTPPADEDPFAIKQKPSATKAVPCSPKPRKGRLQRVVCPMCDTQGFIPKAALGRQVRCANKECLVPVFTAATEDKEAATKAPARISDEEIQVKKTPSKSGSSKSPILMYGIVGGVLLLLTGGLVFYLNQEGTTELDAVNIAMPDPGEDTEPDTKTKDDPTPVVDHRAEALKLVETMISVSRSNRNSNKPLTRRKTGDAYLRLGMEAEATAEFAQMQKNAKQRKVGYYQVGPYVTQYWAKLAAGDDAGAADCLSKAKELSEEIPAAAGLAIESAVALASVLVHTGDIEAASATIARQQRDRSIESQQDSVRAGAWAALSNTLWDQEKTSLPAMQVFAWNEPLVTAVGVELCLRRQWAAATKWADSQKDEWTAADTFASVAAQMVDASAQADVCQTLKAAAAKKSPMISLQTSAVLARDSANGDAWTDASALFAAIEEPRTVTFGSIVDVIESERPELSEVMKTASAMAEYAIAANSRGDVAAATAAIHRLATVLTSTVPVSDEVRQKALKIDEDSNSVKRLVAKELSLSNGNQITSRFIAYRKSVDNFAIAAEVRRLHLLQLLGAIIQNGALDAVRGALVKTDSILAREVYVDELSGMLFVAAEEVGSAFPEILDGHENLHVAIGRISSSDQMAAHKVVPATVSTLQKFSATGDLNAVAELDRLLDQPGFRSAIFTRLIEKTAGQAKTNVSELLNSILQLNNDVWKQDAVDVSAIALVKNGRLNDLSTALDQLPVTPLQRVTALFHIVRGKILAAEQSPSG